MRVNRLRQQGCGAGCRLASRRRSRWRSHPIIPRHPRKHTHVVGLVARALQVELAGEVGAGQRGQHRLAHRLALLRAQHLHQACRELAVGEVAGVAGVGQARQRAHRHGADGGLAVVQALHHGGLEAVEHLVRQLHLGRQVAHQRVQQLAEAPARGGVLGVRQLHQRDKQRLDERAPVLAARLVGKRAEEVEQARLVRRGLQQRRGRRDAMGAR